MVAWKAEKDPRATAPRPVVGEDAKLAEWMVYEFARVLGLNVDDWGDNAKMAEKAQEIYNRGNQDHIFCVLVKHLARKNLQNEAREG
eukprot:9551996-Alexandrium_andersonii.AAC.1